MNSDDEEAIFKEIESFAAAWSKGDAKIAASCYTVDGTRVGAFGDIQNGRSEIEAAYDRLLHQTMPGAVVKLDRGTVRILTDEFAVWQGGMEIIPTGAAAPLKGYVVQVMKKVESRWLVLEGHPKFYPPAPQPK